MRHIIVCQLPYSSNETDPENESDHLIMQCYSFHYYAAYFWEKLTVVCESLMEMIKAKNLWKGDGEVRARKKETQDNQSFQKFKAIIMILLEFLIWKRESIIWKIDSVFSLLVIAVIIL